MTGRAPIPSDPLSDAAAPPPPVALSLVLGFLAFLSLVVTESNYGYAIDEASYLWVAREERVWFSEFFAQPTMAAFSDENLRHRWHFLETPGQQGPGHSNFNLPLSMHAMNLAWLFTGGAFHELWTCRLASMALFAILVAYTHRVVGRVFHPWAGFASAVALVASPRIFGHAHLAATETPLACWWWLTTLALIDPSNVLRPRRWWIVPTLLSLTMAVKLSAWFLAPWILGTILVSPRTRRWRTIIACAVGPLLAVVLLTPPLWHDPITRLGSYLSQVQSNPWTIPSYFGHEVTSQRLPGWTGLALFLITSPVATIAFGAIGIALARPRWPLVVVTGSTLIMLTARVAGLLPTHDVERHFIPALYGWAILAGLGAFEVTRRIPIPNASGLLILILLAEPIHQTWTYRQHGLCYYSELVGGMKGADELGLETTYWLETMTNDRWHEMLDDLPPNASLFLRPDHPGLEDLKRWGVWREDLRSTGPEADVYLLYAKKAAYFLPTADGTSWQPTELGLRARSGPMEREIRFQGVRLMGRTTP